MSTVNHFVPLFLVLLIVRAFLAVDFAQAALNGAVALTCASVPLILFLLKKRADQRTSQGQGATDYNRTFIESTARERQDLLDEAARMRQEERDTYQRELARINRQLEVALATANLARERSHLMTTAYAAAIFALDMATGILRDKQIPVPAMLEIKDTRLRMVNELRTIDATERALNVQNEAVILDPETS